MGRYVSRSSLSVVCVVALVVALALLGALGASKVLADDINVFAPRVQWVIPSDGRTECPIDTEVWAYFDSEMKPDTINRDTFYMEYLSGVQRVGDLLIPVFTRVQTSVAVGWGATSAYLRPQQDLEPGRTYLVHLTGRIWGKHKVTNAWTQLADTPYVWSFTTATPPEIASCVPAPGATEVPVGQQVAIDFDKFVVGVSTDSVYIERSLTHTRVPCSMTRPSGRQVVLQPLEPLTPGVTYRVVVTGAVEGEVGGLSLEGAPVSWAFTTAPRPTIVSRTPGPGATEVPIGESVTIVFDEAMSGVGPWSVYLRRTGGHLNVPCGLTTDVTDSSVVLDPVRKLKPDTSYSITITAEVTSAAGGASLADAPVSWDFRTGPAEPGPVMPSFRDVDTEHIYHDAVYGMRDAGIVEGYQVGDVWEFHPDDTLYRAQFAKMICGALGLPVAEDDWPDPTVPFIDLGEDVLPGPGVANSLYPHEYAAVAYLNQITSGLTATNFGPYERISRGQVVTMIVRACEAIYPGLLLPPPAGYGTLGDFHAIHGPTMRTAEYNGLLAGLAGFGPSWDPWANASRGETAQMLWTLAAMLD